MLELRNVTVSFPGCKSPAVNNFSFSAGKGEKIAVIGENSSGKSTLALAIAGAIPEIVDAEVSGKINIGGKVGVVLQSPSSQFLSLTVSEELSHCEEKGSASHLLKKSVFRLSEGEKQKVNLLANLQGTDILLLDEPLELLDPCEARAFRDEINSLEGKTVVWFDKDERFVRGWKKVRPGEEGKGKKTGGKTKKRKLGPVVLDSRFSIGRGSFEIGNFELGLRQGEKAALIGRNGSGKTTLLRAIAGIEKFVGRVNSKLRFSYAPQNPSHLLFRDTVREEVDEANAKKLGLEKIMDECPSKLSKGRQKIVSVAGIKEGTIALLDEPTTWLDSLNREKVYGFIERAGQAMVIATHDPEIVKLCDRVFLVERGEVKECSSTMAKDFFLAQGKG